MTLEDFLRIRDHKKLLIATEMKMMVSNVGAGQVNVVGGSKRSTGSKICFACDKDGHFRQEVCCTEMRRYWKFWCPQVVQRGGGGLRGAASSDGRFPSRGKVNQVSLKKQIKSSVKTVVYNPADLFSEGQSMRSR